MSQPRWKAETPPESKTIFEITMDFKAGDRVIHTSRHGIIFEATVDCVHENGLLALRFGNRLGIAEPKDCRIKHKRVVHRKGLPKPSDIALSIG